MHISDHDLLLARALAVSLDKSACIDFIDAAAMRMIRLQALTSFQERNRLARPPLACLNTLFMALPRDQSQGVYVQDLIDVVRTLFAKEECAAKGAHFDMGGKGHLTYDEVAHMIESTAGDPQLCYPGALRSRRAYTVLRLAPPWLHDLSMRVQVRR